MRVRTNIATTFFLFLLLLVLSSRLSARISIVNMSLWVGLRCTFITVPAAVATALRIARHIVRFQHGKQFRAIRDERLRAC